MKALCQEYRNGARRNEQRNGENDTYRFSVATMVRETMHSSP
ncbi:Uncharacterised protein [Escherichia coli]|uniref:Uncharacterized protein n=1 Tax=Escherichia coli TaxID=562 RepID=A0A376RJ61_ECOLX|nr:Uncharacterised protein [Escherichia coli]